MYGVIFLIWAILIAPVKLMVFVASSHAFLPSGYICINFFGLSFRLHWQIHHDERGGHLIITLGKHRLLYKPGESDMDFKTIISSIRKSSYAKKMIKKLFYSLRLHVNGRIALGDAALTALFCAALQQCLCRIRWLSSSITPDYGAAGYMLEVKCMMFFRVGTLLLTFVICAVAMMRKSGGAHYGKTGSGHQFSYANRP